MGYRRMTVEHVYEILRRWHSGQSVSRISVAEECDRKTVRKYIQKFNEAGLKICKKLPDKERIWERIETKRYINKRSISQIAPELLLVFFKRYNLILIHPLYSPVSDNCFSHLFLALSSNDSKYSGYLPKTILSKSPMKLYLR